MVLRYAEELEKYSNCPPDPSVTRDNEAFRFVHEEIGNPRNFQCVARLSPRREFDTDAQRCDSWALSFFASHDKAMAFYQKLKRSMKNIERTIGTHLATGQIWTLAG